VWWEYGVFPQNGLVPLRKAERGTGAEISLWKKNLRRGGEGKGGVPEKEIARRERKSPKIG